MLFTLLDDSDVSSTTTTDNASTTTTSPTSHRLEIEATLAPLVLGFSLSYGGDDSRWRRCKCLDCDSGKFAALKAEILGDYPRTSSDAELEEWILALRYRFELYAHATKLVKAVNFILPCDLECKDFHLAERRRIAASIDRMWWGDIYKAVGAARMFSHIERYRENWTPKVTAYIAWALYLNIDVPEFDDGLHDETADPTWEIADARYELRVAAAMREVRQAIVEMQRSASQESQDESDQTDDESNQTDDESDQTDDESDQTYDESDQTDDE
jgi:hypothetical protein